MRRLCDDEAMRVRMGVAAKLRTELFSPDAIVPRFVAAYREAVDARLKKTARRGR